MMYLIGSGLIMLFAAGMVAWVYRGEAKANQYKAAMQRRRAEIRELVDANDAENPLNRANTAESYDSETITCPVTDAEQHRLSRGVGHER